MGMSIRPWLCERCQRACNYVGLQVVAGQEAGTIYGVGWDCPSCGDKPLDVCPLGPLVPGDALCLNCGAAYPSEDATATCPGCGLTRAGALTFLCVGVVPPDAGSVARDLFARGLFRRGMAILNQALARDPAPEAPWLLKSTFLEGLGLHAHLLKMLDGALAVGAPASLLINYGSALHRAGRHEDAIAASQRYLKSEPGGPWGGAAHTNLGLALRALGRDAEAEEWYRHAIHIDPGQVLHYRNLAQLLIDQQRWSGALGTLEAGLEHASMKADQIRFLEGLAFVCAEEERAAQALDYIDRAIALGSGSGRTLYLRGRALALLGRLEEARADVRRVLELEPKNIEATQALAMIEQALTEG
jgi:tetratricopeptide (TPR) repeat protein